MLKQLLKYEFKATKRLYFGLYLALALLSVVLGVTFRQEHALAHSTSFQNLEVILMIVYVSVILAIAVLCFVNTIQRFYQNLLGREGYLMHTLPVNENQLILSKLLTSMVWVLCSGLVGIVCITVMVSIGVIDSETFGMVDWNSWKQLWQMLYEEIGPEFWVAMAWTILINLARLADRTEVSGETVFFYTRQAGPLLAALQREAQVRTLHRPANLEDLFLKLTGRQIREGA